MNAPRNREHSVKRLLVLLLAGSALQPGWGASSDNALACVDPDVIQTLLGNPGEGAIRITRDWPAGFPPIDTPDDFALIGSRSSAHFSLVSFKSKRAVSDVRAALRSSFDESEWLLPEAMSRAATGGFQNPSSTNVQDALSACHDKHGQMTALFSQAPAGATYITLMSSMRSSGMSCSQMYSRFMPIQERTERLPKLALPEDASATALGGPIISNGSEAASTRIQLDTRLSAGEQLVFFGRQLNDQDWEQEAEWVGRVVSGSAWISKDGAKSGLLRIHQKGQNKFKLDFQVILVD